MPLKRRPPQLVAILDDVRRLKQRCLAKSAHGAAPPVGGQHDGSNAS
jgi:hypothetical protein